MPEEIQTNPAAESPATSASQTGASVSPETLHYEIGPVIVAALGHEFVAPAIAGEARKAYQQLVPTSPLSLEEKARIKTIRDELESKDFRDESGNRLLEAVRNVREAYGNLQSTTWDLANSLLAMEQAYIAKWDRKPTQGDFIRLLKLDLTRARLGQLLNTARFFKGVEVDRKADFRLYEEARKAHDRAAKAGLRTMPKEQLARAAKEGKDVYQMLAVKEWPSTARKLTHVLSLRIAVATTPEGKDSATFSFDGQRETIGDDPRAVVALHHAIAEARKLLDKMEQTYPTKETPLNLPDEENPFTNVSVPESKAGFTREDFKAVEVRES
jgi:hypothetical protein